MKSDVKLNGSNITIEANHIETTAHDLKLNHPQRRKGGGPHRRALVHGFKDELVLNYARDYPGGVSVHGALEVLGNKNQPILRVNPTYGNLVLGGSGADGDLWLNDRKGQPSIKIAADEKALVFNALPNWPRWSGQRASTNVNLIDELRRMKEEILELKKEITRLKK